MAVLDSANRRSSMPQGLAWLAGLLLALDARLRRRQAVFEYSQNPLCIFRLQVERSAQARALRDGTRVQPGSRIARLHYWNDHVPRVPPEGATIAWGRRMQQAIAISLRELARYLSERPDFDDIVMVCADVPNGVRGQSAQLARIMGRYGFEASTGPQHLAPGERLHRLGENILITLVVLAQNPAALRRDTLMRVRVPIFLARQALDRRFGPAREIAETVIP